MLVRRCSNVGENQKLERIILFAPDDAQLVAGPAAFELGCDFFVADDIILPAACLKKRRKHIKRR